MKSLPPLPPSIETGDAEDPWRVSTTIRDTRARAYEILELVNAGGMGAVYRGRLRGALGFSRIVALKAMHPHYATDPTFRDMFIDEARITALLQHPNIIPTIDVVSTRTTLMLVMEYVDGLSLHQIAEQEGRGPIPFSVASAIVHDMLVGLHHAHEAKDENGRELGIIHRDVSPQNLLVGRDGLARVLDFGIAKARNAIHLTNDGAVRGKVAYMAPEQLRGVTIDRRVDVYSAGIVLWEVLTGRRLFEGEGIALASTILTSQVTPPSAFRPDIPPELDAIVMQAITHDPNERFPTALAMADALRALVPLASRRAITRWVANEPEEEVALSADFERDPPAWADRSITRISSKTVPSKRKRKPRFTSGLFLWLLIACTMGIVAGARHRLGSKPTVPVRTAAAATAVRTAAPRIEPTATAVVTVTSASVVAPRPTVPSMPEPTPPTSAPSPEASSSAPSTAAAASASARRDARPAPSQRPHSVRR